MLRFLLFLFVSFSLFSNIVHDSLIIGGGPGALSAAIYMARAQVTPLVLEGKEPGGLISKSYLVENWPGQEAIEGALLSDKLRSQAIKNGAQLLNEEVVRVDFSKRPYKIFSRKVGDKKEIMRLSKTVIIAMGTKPNFLGIPGEKKFWGKGVTNCAVCDGPLYRNQRVAVVGGGDGALLEADFLSTLAKEVHIFVRKNRFRTVEDARMQKVLSKKNVQVHFQSTLKEIKGDHEGVKAVKTKGGKVFDVEGVFLAIGSKPNTQLFRNELQLLPSGHVRLYDGQKTSKEGVYAVGDIADPIYKQAISAAGDGCKAALEAQYAIFSYVDQTHYEVATKKELDQLINSAIKPVIIDFYAPWCRPCKRLIPYFDQRAEEKHRDYTFVKINIDKAKDIATHFKIRSVPTMIEVHQGKEKRFSGTGAIQDYLSQLK